MNLYQLTTEVKGLEELITESINEETGEIENADVLQELEKEVVDQLTNKSTGIIKYFRNNDLTLEMIDEEIKRLQALKKVKKNENDNFKKYVIYCMEQMGVKKIETPLGNISLRASKSVDVYDEMLVDKKYFKEVIEYKLSKTDLKKAIESGEDVQGARIVRKNSLIIK